ncbi:MAG: M20/M25/M40 family metallo-hydrolase [Gammaproteobacteria bacterium]|nr:M20/M25/M40 family metallo-hydrolase [Gammaproteobacteria bacterium]
MPKSTDQRLSRRGFVRSAGALAAIAALPPGARGAKAAPKAVELANERRDELIELLVRMIRVQSLSGESAAEAQGIVSQYLSDLPYRIDESADRPSHYDSHPEFMPPNPPGDGPFVNIVGWPEGTRAGNHAMFSHIDTHSIDPGWQTKPLEPVIRGNRMYGLGTSDDKGGVAAMLVAAAVLAETGSPLPVVMSLHGKGGGSRGSLPVFERLRGIDHGIDAVLYVHPAETGRGLADIKNAVQGIVDLELTVTGWRGPQMEIGSIDSSDWQTGGNAIEMSWRALERLRRSVFKDVLFNLGMIDGGDRIGSVAAKAATRFRLKFSGEHTWRGLLRSARDELASFAENLPDSDPAYAFSLEAVAYRTNPGEADWNAPVSRVLRNSIRDVTGRAPVAYPNHYAGDIRYPIRLLDVPAYGIGSVGGNFYGPNEWVDIDDLVQLVAVLIQTLSGWSELND